MNIIKRLAAWFNVDPQQDDLDARRDHYEMLGVQGAAAVKLMEQIGAKWLPFSSMEYAWRIGGDTWEDSRNPFLVPLNSFETWHPDYRESAAIFTLGLLGYRWSATFHEFRKRTEPQIEQKGQWQDGYVAAFYKVAETLQVKKGDFVPEGMSMSDVVEHHILSLLAVEREYLKLMHQGKEDKPSNIKISSHGVAVDQDYFWNYDMNACPQGKVQLLGNGGIPAYGYKAQGAEFWQAWAPLPKTRK